MRHQEIISTWNAGADEYNQWDNLGEDEKIEFAHRAGWEQGKQQASGICKADIQEHAITISAAQQETHNNCCNYLAKAIDAMEYNHGN